MVVIAGDDFTVRGGSADASTTGKLRMSEQMAAEFRLPLIRLIEGSGGGGSVKTIETTGRANLPGGLSDGSSIKSSTADDDVEQLQLRSTVRWEEPVNAMFVQSHVSQYVLIAAWSLDRGFVRQLQFGCCFARDLSLPRPQHF